MKTRIRYIIVGLVGLGYHGLVGLEYLGLVGLEYHGLVDEINGDKTTNLRTRASNGALGVARLANTVYISILQHAASCYASTITKYIATTNAFKRICAVALQTLRMAIQAFIRSAISKHKSVVNQPR